MLVRFDAEFVSGGEERLVTVVRADMQFHGNFPGMGTDDGADGIQIRFGMTHGIETQ